MGNSIYKYFSSIPPVVFWKFEQVFDTFNNNEKTDVVPSIKFQNIFPLFASIDIIDSSQAFFQTERKAYANSVNKINDIITAHLNIGQPIAQKIIPHIFQKFKSDGIGFNIYAGQSLHPSIIFEEEKKSALKFWQLKILCQIIQKLRQAKLDVPLRTRQFILPYEKAIDISYRRDENRFDIEGPEHVHFEILKKHLKAATASSDNVEIIRPGSLTIFYRLPTTTEEYSHFFQQLIHEGLIDKKVEHLTIKLPFEQLRALRIAVNS